MSSPRHASFADDVRADGKPGRRAEELRAPSDMRISEYLGTRFTLVYRTTRLYCSNRSLGAWGHLLWHMSRRPFNRSLVPFITISPTYRCQCRCVHCCANAAQRDHRDELETWEVKSVIDQAKGLGVLQVTFSGGEPLLREDIVELVQHAHRRGLLTRINTNGLLLDRSLVRELRKAGLTQGAVSIDDTDPETHDRLRGLRGAHAKALKGITNLLEAGILCQISTYASRRNLTEGLQRIISLGRRLGVLSIYIILPVAAGCWEGQLDERLTEEEQAKARALQIPGFVFLELPSARTLCGVSAKTVLFVSPRGDVTPCPFVPFAFGNIRERTLNELWTCHCRSFDMVCRGQCIMNDPVRRDELRRHVDSVVDSVG